MENRQQQILEEIKDMVVSLKHQIEGLELKLSQLQPKDEQVEENLQEVVVNDEHIDDMEMEVSIEIDDDLPFFDDAAPVVVPVEEVAFGPTFSNKNSETENQDIATEIVEEVVVEDKLETIVEEKPEDATPVAMIDAMVAKQAWRTDMPGTPVRDIRSAISLNDRILFINYLFNEDPMAFQETLTALNSMSSFDEAVSHVTSLHPEWNLESDTVYRFMMALRRRLQ